MSMSLNSTIKTGGSSCPHGMPAGACPLCNGMGGGASQRKPAAKEMSWDECYAIGLMMKANKARAKEDAQNMQNAALQNSLLMKIANAISQRLANLQSFIADKVITPVIKTAKAVISKVFSPVINIAKNIASMAQKAFNAIKEQLINIMDKLTAIFGETKKALEKIVSDNFKKLKKGFLNFLGIDTELEQGEDGEELDLKRIEDLKKFKEKITKIFKKDKEDKWLEV